MRRKTFPPIERSGTFNGELAVSVVQGHAETAFEYNLCLAAIDKNIIVIAGQELSGDDRRMDGVFEQQRSVNHLFHRTRRRYPVAHALNFDALAPQEKPQQIDRRPALCHDRAGPTHNRIVTPACPATALEAPA